MTWIWIKLYWTWATLVPKPWWPYKPSLAEFTKPCRWWPKACWNFFERDLVIGPGGMLIGLETCWTCTRSLSWRLDRKSPLTCPCGKWPSSGSSLAWPCWIYSAGCSSTFPLSSKGFVLESKASPISKGLKSATLNVALTLYSPGRSTL